MCCKVPNITLSLIHQIKKDMKSRLPVLKFILVVSVLLTGVNEVKAQSQKSYPVDSSLYVEIARMDSLLFTAFNNRDLETTKKIFSTEVEFYHDKGGLTNYAQIIENTKQLFEKNNDLTRELVAGSMEVYPVKDFGAMQIGMHRFRHIENGKMEYGTFKFVHIWKKGDGAWKLTRVISYDH